MRVLVCGGRAYADNDRLYATLDDLDLDGSVSAVIEGGASGADALACRWAISRGVPIETFRADWVRYGRSAGPRRNAQMLLEGKPDLVIAFAGGRGTANMVALARKSGIRVIEVA